MKKEYFITLMFYLCFSIRAEAQLEKGTGYAAATLFFNGSNSRSPSDRYDKAPTSAYLLVSPSIQLGHFIRSNQMIGIGVSVPMSISTGKSYVGSTNGPFRYHSVQVEYTLSPYWRAYKSIHTKWAVFVTSSADLAYLHYGMKYRDTKTKQDGYSAGLKLLPGVSYWISPRFALESDINLFSLQTGFRDFQDQKAFFFSSGLTTRPTSYFSVRASWYFQKK